MKSSSEAVSVAAVVVVDCGSASGGFGELFVGAGDGCMCGWCW